jgi:hypothetical protein
LFEFRGGIEEYCKAASKLLKPFPSISLFVVCETSLAIQRGYTGATAAGLSVIARVDCVPKVGKPPLFCVYIMCLCETAALVRKNSSLVESLKSAFKEDFISNYKDGILYPYADMRTDVYKAGIDASIARSKLAVADTLSLHASTTTTETIETRIKKKQTAHGKHLDLLGKPLDKEILVHVVTVRDILGNRTESYIKLLSDLGKPS